MKKLFFILSILLLTFGGTVTNTVHAQTVADIFLAETPITWLGVDYSQMKFVGPLDISSSQMDDYAKVLNDLYLREPKKYNLTSAFNKNSISTNLSYIEKANAAMNTDNVASSDSKDMSRFTKESIEKIVKNYHLKESGIGLVYVAEALSKTEESGAYWVTFVDMQKGTVLLTERVTGKAVGFGFRNYWAGSFYGTLKQIKGGLYQKWKKNAAK